MNKIEYSISELAVKANAEFQGNGLLKINSVAPLHKAAPGQLTFLDNTKYRKYLSLTKASVAIVTLKDLPHCRTNAIISEHPSLTYAKIAKLFQTYPPSNPGIHPSAIIGENCNIDSSVSIGAYCVIEDNVTIAANTIINACSVIGQGVEIGSHCRIWSNVTLYYGVQLGNYVEIHSGAIIGADGFGLAQTTSGFTKIPQLGTVIIGDDVEIGANTTIDRGAIESTTIDRGVKLDNQIQIGHNVKIGENTVVAGCVGIAGSTKIGKNCMIGGGAGIAGHIEIADNVMITAMTGISKPIKEPGIYSAGIQADKRQNWKKNAVAFRHLGEMGSRLDRLEALLKLTKEEG